ncbi:Putative ribonuclease H protein At1g65750 [Linum perenne]
MLEQLLSQHKEFGLTFGITIWILWKARNEAIFENKLATCDQLRLRVLHWIVGVRETMRADSQVISKVASRRIDTHIGWKAGPSDCITINTDGSVLQPHSQAAAGGILTTSMGRLMSTFVANLGRCSIMRAELCVAEIGLMIVWDMGF